MPSDSEKCIYDSGSCVIKKVCDLEPTLEEAECQNSITSHPSTTECFYDSDEAGENKCKVKEKCELKDSPETESDCFNIEVTDEDSKCVLDETGGAKTCKVKKVCNNNLSEDDCNSATTLTPQTTKCQFNSELSENKCEEKEFCEIETAPSLAKCKEIPVSDSTNKKCTYNSSSGKCEIKTLCLKEEDASAEKCPSAPTSDDDKNKCIYNDQEGKCEEKTLCNKVTTPSKLSCASAITEDETKTRCFFEAKDDSKSGDTDKCITKEICSEVNSPSADTCRKATTLDPKTKCSFEEGSGACTPTNRGCTEIIDDASTVICESIETSSGKECKYDEINGKCVEITLCKNVGTITDETLCTTAPTSNDLTMKCVVKTVEGTKSCNEEPKTCSEIKNGATDEICANAPVTDSTKKKCKLNTLKAGECIETDKENEIARKSRNWG